ncbi:MAG: AraC family transcriptional regulator [Lachnospiraceae bacterium]|nr:AraC family transcriptional regulator [Lachnospiraceae bacterium]
MSEEKSNRYLIEQIIRTHVAGKESENYIEILSPVQFTQETCLIGSNGNNFVNFLLASPSHLFTHFFRSEQEIRTFNGRSPHHHDFYELLIVLDGEVHQEIEHSEFTFRKGSCCLMNRNISHKEMFYSPAKILFIGLSKALVQQLSEAEQNCFSPKEELPGKNPLLSFMIENSHKTNGKEYLDFMPTMTNDNWMEVLDPLCLNFMNIIQHPFPGSTLILEGLLLQLMAYIGDNSHFHMSKIQVKSAPDYLLYCHICRLMEETNGRISRAELEKTLHYSGNYLNTIMKKYSGTNLSNFGISICMKKAADLLASTDLPIAEIMTYLQFTNTTQFYNCFRAVYCQTPGAYRNNIKTDTLHPGHDGEMTAPRQLS